MSAFPVILFYKYVPIDEPAILVAALKTFCAERGIRGRVLIAEEGINGTLSGEADAIHACVAWLQADSRFHDMEFKWSDSETIPFPRLVIKMRPEIVTLQADRPLTADQDNHLTPEEWKRTIEENPDIVLVDVRNRYESAAGHFEGAIACDISHFRELPDYVIKLDHLKDKPVLMYCTGGIRCEKASALFRSEGFRDVRQLHGGIIKYQENFGNEHWLGECFVFDDRMSTRVEEGLKQVGSCAHTGRPSTRFVNCLHDPCHKLFILSEEAEEENSDYQLCPECLAAGITHQTADRGKQALQS